MDCERCRYWKPTYAEFAQRLVMTCTCDDKIYDQGRCGQFENIDEAKNIIRKKKKEYRKKKNAVI